MNEFKIIECPRDAMQGIKEFIPSERKVAYINSLLKVGFDTVDFGSFVSPRAVPQMADTGEVLKALDTSGKSSLLAIVANERGARDAAVFNEIKYLGIPVSVSETFQLRNSRQTMKESLEVLSSVNSICRESGKKLVAYISMGFGNPYGDEFSIDILLKFAEKIAATGIDVISVSDTVGKAEPKDVEQILGEVNRKFPTLEVGAHLHSTSASATDKVRAVIQSGVTRLDGALGGYGGCPFAEDELVGNLPTEIIVKTLEEEGINPGLDKIALENAMKNISRVF